MAIYYANNVSIFIKIILKIIKKHAKTNKNLLNKNNYNINFNYSLNINN